jgi:integrase
VKLIIQDNDFRLNDTIGISKYISKRVDELLNKEGYSKSTLNMAISRLRSVFHFAIEANIMTNNPVKSWMKSKDVKHKFSICSRQQLNEFFSRMEEFIADKENVHRVKTAYRAYYAIKLVSITGMRRGEVQKLRVEHIMKNKLIIDGKGDRQREFPYSINPALKPLLDDILAYGNRLSGSTPYLLGHSSPSAMGVLLESFKKAIGLSDYKNLKYHAIRKLVENEMMNDDKLNDNLVRSLIGHTIVTQSQHYLNRLTAEEIEEIVEKNKTK